jgi:hypothetical protein
VQSENKKKWRKKNYFQLGLRKEKKINKINSKEMIQLDSSGYKNADSESNSTHDEG